MGEAAAREVSRARRIAATLAMGSVAGGLAALAIDKGWIQWSLLAFAGLVGAAGIGLSRRSVVVQVLSRGVGWLVFAPMAIATFVTMGVGHFDWQVAALAAGTGSALALAHPMLLTKEARESFAPSRFRRWFLASATASATVGVTAGIFAIDAMFQLYASSVLAILALGAIAFSSLSAAIGTIRMRAWGILLGLLSTLVAVGAAVVAHDLSSLAFAMAAVPGLMLGAPIAAARLAKDKPRLRVDASASERLRVDTSSMYAEEGVLATEVEHEPKLARVALPSPERPTVT